MTYLTCVVCSRAVARREILLGFGRRVDDDLCVCQQCVAAGAARPSRVAGAAVAKRRWRWPLTLLALLGAGSVALVLWLTLRSDGDRGAGETGTAVAARVPTAPMPSPGNAAAETPPRAAGRPAASPRPLNLAELEAIKRATVLIRTHAAVGSGFLFRRRASDPTLIATNYHVIGAGGMRHEEVLVILGSGTAGEECRQARLAAFSEADDLAVLRLDGAPPAASLELAREAVIETQPIRIAGFPFGELLERRLTDSPGLTFTAGTVSSLRYDDYGRLDRVQLDADVNPGNSGGPVLDDEGGVVGIAVETLLTTDISFMIPVEALDRLLDGGVTQVVSDVRGSVLRVHLEVQDPLERLVKAGLKAFPPGREPEAGHRTWPFEVGGRTVATRASPSGRVALDAPLDSRDRVLWFQPWFERSSGIVGLAPFSVDLRPGVALEPALRVEPTTPAQGEDWLGGVGRWSKSAELRPQVTGDDLGGIPRLTEGIHHREIRIVGGRVRDVAWAPRGRWFYLLEADGTVHRIGAKTLREERKLALESFAASLATSRQGLVVSLPPVREALILDFDDLRPRGAISTPPLDRIASSPDLDTAYGLTTGGERLVVLDLEERRIRGEFGLRELVLQGCQRSSRTSTVSGRVDDLVTTPDGRFLVIAAEGSLIRIRVRDESLQCEEIGPPLGLSPGVEILLSPDGRYVALPKSRSYRLPDAPQWGTHVFRVDDLSHPVVSVGSQEQPHPSVLAFDPIGSRILGFDNGNRITVFSRGGAPQRSVELGPRDARPQEVHVSPDGAVAILVTAPRLIHLDLEWTGRK